MLWSSKRMPQSQFKSEDKEIAILIRSCNLREKKKNGHVETVKGPKKEWEDPNQNHRIVE